jgi:hypothetical protein
MPVQTPLTYTTTNHPNRIWESQKDGTANCDSSDKPLANCDSLILVIVTVKMSQTVMTVEINRS